MYFTCRVEKNKHWKSFQFGHISYGFVRFLTFFCNFLRLSTIHKIRVFTTGKNLEFLWNFFDYRKPWNFQGIPWSLMKFLRTFNNIR